MNGMILSHIPVHADSIERFGCNIHGHLHANRVMKQDTSKTKLAIDPRYHCVCVEHTDYAPISLEEVNERIKAEGGTVGFRNGNGSVIM